MAVVCSIQIDLFISRKLRRITVTVAVASLVLLMFLRNMEHDKRSNKCLSFAKLLHVPKKLLQGSSRVKFIRVERALSVYL